MPKDANLILPAERVVALSPVHKLTQTIVNLRYEDAHQMTWGKDPTFMPAKAQVEELAAAAGVKIVDSKPLESGHENHIMWQVAAIIRKPDGDHLEARKTYSLDLRHKERDGVDGTTIILLRQRKWDQAERAIEKGGQSHYGDMPPRDAPREDWQAWVDAKALRELEQIDRHRVSRAETGAALRAIRSLLNLKSSYTKPELEKPFMVYTVTFDTARAIQLGGKIGEDARKLVAASLAQQLGLDSSITAGLLSAPSEEEKDEQTDLLPLSDEGRTELLSFLAEHGIEKQQTAERFILDLFGTSIYQVDSRQARLIKESFQVIGDSTGRIAEEEAQEFRAAIRTAVQLAYAQGTSIGAEIEQRWYDEIYAEPEPEPEEEVEEEGEVIDGEVVGFGDVVSENQIPLPLDGVA